jgi:hypothetical protein
LECIGRDYSHEVIFLVKDIVGMDRPGNERSPPAPPAIGHRTGGACVSNLRRTRVAEVEAEQLCYGHIVELPNVRGIAVAVNRIDNDPTPK